MSFEAMAERVRDIGKNRIGVLTPKEEEALCFLKVIGKNKYILLDPSDLIGFSGLKDGDKVLITYCTEEEKETHRRNMLWRPLHPKTKYFQI